MLKENKEYPGWGTKQIWQKEEKEEPSGKMNLTTPHNIPCQTSSPHRTELSCESCLSDGQSSAPPESHTGTSLSTLSAAVRFWAQIFWSEPEMGTRMMDRDQNTFTHWGLPANTHVIEWGARFSKKALNGCTCNTCTHANKSCGAQMIHFGMQNIPEIRCKHNCLFYMQI